MTTKHSTSRSARIGDVVQTRGLRGQPPRRGEIIELLGRDEHERYRVRWEDGHESIVYPADGVLIQPGRPHARRGGH